MRMPPANKKSRTIGSGGNRIGLLVARHLGRRFCDQHILRHVAQTLGIPLASLRRRHRI
ncbi:MAG: cytidylate kinase family protein [Holophagaceae bacterium]|uniref:Cytidylate kinase family protein n=1 Tax=Candidatus Geothrix odensensis TaxID=2954440 RepID=A0A936F443_9BACT|nr:cytidylate kinase family protein [Candidatus Geothrix odensensis]